MKTLTLLGEKETRFTVALKAKPEARDAPPRKRILIADDDASIRESLARVLEGENYDVALAESGRKAVSQFLQAVPELVLLDLNMPDKDGWQAFELMEKLRPFVPIIIITARPNQYERAVATGADALMEKPLDLPLLLQTIQELLAESPQQRVAHLTDRNFSTAFLSRSADGKERSAQ